MCWGHRARSPSKDPPIYRFRWGVIDLAVSRVLRFRQARQICGFRRYVLPDLHHFCTSCHWLMHHRPLWTLSAAPGRSLYLRANFLCPSLSRPPVTVDRYELLSSAVFSARAGSVDGAWVSHRGGAAGCRAAIAQVARWRGYPARPQSQPHRRGSYRPVCGMRLSCQHVEKKVRTVSAVG